MAAIVTGIGTALPAETRSTNFYVDHAKQFLCETPRQAVVLKALYRRTEISSRASVLNAPSYGKSMERMYYPRTCSGDLGPGTEARMQCYASEVSNLAIVSCRRALADAGIESDTITHLVTVSCTGFFAPGFDVQLIEELPLKRETERTHIGFMGCHGAMNALRVARGLVAIQPESVVLLCAAELCSLHFQYEWTPDNVVANALFSDGAAALIIRSAPPQSPEGMRGANGVNVISSGSFLVPNTADEMTWQVSDHGFKMRLAATVPDIVCEWLPGWMNSWLGRSGYSLSDIAGWIVHPGGPRILDAVESCLQLREGSLAASRALLSECGNMSSPTVLFILERMRRTVTGPCVMLGFGPGLTIEAALLMLP
jgi:predicted naringenin-chalcone synthase